MATTKLILTNEVSKLGGPGDVVEVKAGYARNYLLPRGLATPWTKGAERQLEQMAAASKVLSSAYGCICIEKQASKTLIAP